MPKSSPSSRALMYHGSFHDTLHSQPAPQKSSNNYSNGLGSAISNDSSLGTLRFPTEAERGTPHQLYYSEDDNPLPSGSVPQTCTSLDFNDALQDHDSLDSAQADTVGPMRVAKNHSRRQPPNHIPRPRNAFILYRSWYVKEGFLSGVENDHREISRIVGKIWKQLSTEEQESWKRRAENEKAEHARMYPNYKYSPNSRRDAAAAASSSAGRNSLVRSSNRSRKAKVSETPPKERSDAIADAFVTGSRKLSLTLDVRKMDDRIEAEESEIQSTYLTHPTSASGQPSAEPERPYLSVYSRAPSVDLVSNSVSNDRIDRSNVHGTLLDVNYEPTSDFSLAAYSILPNELSPESVQLLSPEEYYTSETFLKTALRQDYDASATLGTGVTCGHETNLSLTEFPTDSNLYSPTSYTSATPSYYAVAPEPGLSPFGRVLHEGTWDGHPEAIPYDTPIWNTLLSSCSAATNTNSSLPSDLFSNFSWGHNQDCSTTEEEYSASSVSRGEMQSDEYKLFSEWCTPDSPIATDGPGDNVLTHTSLSSGAPLSLIYPSPTYPPKPSALLYHSWDTGCEDMDAYRSLTGPHTPPDGTTRSILLTPTTMSLPTTNETPASSTMKYETLEEGALVPSDPTTALIGVLEPLQNEADGSISRRPRNPFILFRTWYIKQGHLKQVTSSGSELSKITGKLWKAMHEEDRKFWAEQARLEREASQGRTYAPPAASRPRGARNARKRAMAASLRYDPLAIRVPDPTDQRMDNIVQLIMAGKTGDEIGGELRKQELQAEKASSSSPAMELPSLPLVAPVPRSARSSVSFDTLEFQSQLALSQLDQNSPTSSLSPNTSLQDLPMTPDLSVVPSGYSTPQGLASRRGSAALVSQAERSGTLDIATDYTFGMASLHNRAGSIDTEAWSLAATPDAGMTSFQSQPAPIGHKEYEPPHLVYPQGWNYYSTPVPVHGLNYPPGNYEVPGHPNYASYGLASTATWYGPEFVSPFDVPGHAPLVHAGDLCWPPEWVNDCY
ncbi:unnamed protein product [Rhizoctonia solani]|uniref:HMG box domain-containing protein n=1 Tax=Rhizoctonia solani TaxID=456999 RepID=A0A8H3GDX3_9AGAM|nr:unnamed protein product [Rhizoctonia solani]